MSYIALGAKVESFLISGTDYTDRLVSWEVSDSSPITTGLVITTGTVTIGASASSENVDYYRSRFKRGESTVLSVRKSNGAVTRHPRGLLYVISSSYDNESGYLSVEVGCELALRSLTNDFEDLLDTAPIPLDPERSNFQSLGLSYVSAGRFLYMDSFGVLRDEKFFEGDSETVTASGKWTSILGATTAEVAPLSGSDPVPDSIKLTYQVPDSSDSLGEAVKISTSEEDSTYYLTYPATLYDRVPDPDSPPIPEDVDDSTVINPSDGNPSSCGGTAPPSQEEPSESGVNAGNQPVSNCSAGYKTVERQETIGGRRKQKQESRYEGIGSQISVDLKETRVTSVELNGAYFADRFAYCRATFGSYCDPNGGCELFGSNTMSEQSKVITTYNYAEDGSLKEQVVDTYSNLLSAARPSDWRSGVVDGEPQDFREIADTQMYRSGRTIVTYSVDKGNNVSVTKRYESPATYGDGIGYSQGDSLANLASDIDALNGRISFSTRRSSTSSTLSEKPDNTARVSTSTTEKVFEIPVFVGRYTGPSSAGPYVLEESMPVPLLYEDESSIDAALSSYITYLLRSTKGDALGLSLSEMLRDEVVDQWTPNMPFRFADTQADKIVALRMDSTAWVCDSGFAAFSTNALWMGLSNGTVVFPENVTGNATPIIPSPGNPVPPDPTPPEDIIIDPDIENETIVDQGAAGFVVDVYWTMGSVMTPLGDSDGVVASSSANEVVIGHWTTMCYCAGLVVEAGDLLNTTFNGSVALSYGGSLLTDDATIVDANLFA